MASSTKRELPTNIGDLIAEGTLRPSGTSRSRRRLPLRPRVRAAVDEHDRGEAAEPGEEFHPWSHCDRRLCGESGPHREPQDSVGAPSPSATGAPVHPPPCAGERRSPTRRRQRRTGRTPVAEAGATSAEEAAVWARERMAHDVASTPTTRRLAFAPEDHAARFVFINLDRRSSTKEWRDDAAQELARTAAGSDAVRVALRHRRPYPSGCLIKRLIAASPSSCRHPASTSGRGSLRSRTPRTVPPCEG